jgi:hypothetical protein
MINPPTPPSNGSNDRHQRVALALAGPFSDLDPPLLSTIEKALGVCLIVGIFRAYRAHRSKHELAVGCIYSNMWISHHDHLNFQRLFFNDVCL